MTTDRAELHELVDALPESQVASVAADLRRRATAARPASDRAFAWIAMGVTKDGVTDVSSNVDKYLDGFGADSL